MKYLTYHDLMALPDEAVVEVSWRRFGRSRTHAAGAVKLLAGITANQETRYWLFERCQTTEQASEGYTSCIGDELCETCNGTYLGHPFCSLTEEFMVLCDGKHAYQIGAVDA